MLSVVCFWEVVLKSMQGKIDVGAPDIWWANSLEQLRAKSLGIFPEYVTVASSLSPIHQDSFDRRLTAQSQVTGIVLIAAVRSIVRYAAPKSQMIE